MSKIVAILVFVLGFVTGSFGGSKRQGIIHPEYSYRHYTTDDGLPSYSIEAIYQDRKGFIWVGTVEGLARYDGFEFIQYLPGKFTNISRIASNKNNDVLAYGFDLYTIDNQSDSVICQKLPKGYYAFNNNHSALPPDYAVLCATKNEEKSLFQLTNSGFVKILSHSDLDKLDEYSGRPYIDEQERKIYVPVGEGISILSFSGEKLSFIPVPNVLRFVRNGQQLWFIAQNGLYRIEGPEAVSLAKFTIGVDVVNVSACFDSGGTLFFCDNEAVYRYISATGSIEKVFSGVNLVKDMVIDSEDNLWVATYQGLYNLFRLQFTNYFLADKKDVVRGIIDDDEGNMLAGTLRGKLLRFNAVSQDTIVCPANKYGSFFGGYYARQGNSIYLPGAGKILRLQGRQVNWLEKLPVLGYEVVTALPDGTLAAVSPSSIKLFVPSGDTIGSLSFAKMKQKIYAPFVADANGNRWTGGPKGISLLRNDSVKVLSSDQLKPCLVTAVDRQGQAWFGVENRLYATKSDSVELVHTFSSHVNDVLFTKKGKIVVSTSNGIAIFESSFRNKYFYDKFNGFTGKETMRSRIVEDSSGKVWVPSVTCLVCFDPEKLMNKQPIPKLYINSLSTSTDNIHWNKVDSEDVRLSHAHKNLKFSYIGLSYSLAENVRYQYRLIGFQDQWSQPIAKREVTFNNLSPGKYVFEIKCFAGAPETQTSVISLPLVIEPAFWQTWWFKLFAVIFVLLAIVWGIVSFMRNKYREKVSLVNREKEMNELRVQSIRLKSIPHFNSNVLAGIEYFIMTKSTEDANRLLATYSRFTNVTLHDIDKARRPLKNEIEYVKMYLELEKMRYGNKLDFSIEIDPDTDQNMMVPNMVMHTYAENAVKHGIRAKSTGGIVLIRVSHEGRGVRIAVEDNGVGREASAKKNAEINRKGHGLSILMRQIELYNQQNDEKIEEKVVDLLDDNGNAAGTRFELYVPYKYNYL